LSVGSSVGAATPPDGGRHEIVERLAVLRDFEAVDCDHLLRVRSARPNTAPYVLVRITFDGAAFLLIWSGF
jgi:hypothetical protein